MEALEKAGEGEGETDAETKTSKELTHVEELAELRKAYLLQSTELANS